MELLQQVRDDIKIGNEVQRGIAKKDERKKDKGKDLTQQIQIINTISGGSTMAGTSNNSRRNYARKVPRLNEKE